MTGAPLVAGRLTAPIVAPLQVRHAGHRSSPETPFDEPVRLETPTPRDVSGNKWSRRRLLRGAATLAAFGSLASFASGITLARYSSTTTSSSNTFTAGTVTVGSPSSTESCDISGAFPGTSSTSACTFGITYTGDVPAYLSADVLIVSNGSVWDGSATGSLSFTLTDTSNNPYTMPTTTVTCGTVNVSDPQFGNTASGGTNCGEQSDDLLAGNAVSTTTNFSLRLSWTLPSSSPSSAQGSSVQVYVVFHAVQADDNGSLAGCPVGQPCSGAGKPSWS